MELKLCKQQIAGLEKSYVSVDFHMTCKGSLGCYLYAKLHQKDLKCRLDTAKEELASIKYHPVREHNKMKICNSCESHRILYILKIVCLVLSNQYQCLFRCHHNFMCCLALSFSNTMTLFDPCNQSGKGFG